MQVADGVDNDCDGLIDEELCTPDNAGRGEFYTNGMALAKSLCIFTLFIKS